MKMVKFVSEKKKIQMFFFKIGWQTEISDEMLTEIKSVLSNLRISGAAITRKAVIGVGNGMFSACCLEHVATNGGSMAY